MNYDSSDTQDQHQNAESANTNPHHSTHSTKSAFEDIAKSVREAMNAGKRDAKDAFEKILPNAKRDVAKGVHDVAYAVSFAAVFGATILRELAPDSLKEGIKRGSAAGKKSADEAVKNRREREQRESEASDGPVILV